MKCLGLNQKGYPPHPKGHLAKAMPYYSANAVVENVISQQSQGFKSLFK